jgi:hypothetical protein
MLQRGHRIVWIMPSLGLRLKGEKYGHIAISKIS